MVRPYGSAEENFGPDIEEGLGRLSDEIDYLYEGGLRYVAGTVWELGKP